ncbi:hypothetical protein [Providencia manganoxydans]|uniref:hypothetical protein n=1 Tax=Providencia manganoxydans TaxID=2923283 RepID=UPI0032DB42A6
MILPNKLFYTLEEAAIKLSKNEDTHCTVNDLLHFASIGAFEPLIFVDGEWESTGKYLDDFAGQEYFQPTQSSLEQTYLITFCGAIRDEIYEFNLCEINIMELDKEDEEYNPIDLFYLSISGFVAFKPSKHMVSFFHLLSVNKEIDISHCFAFIPLSAKMKFVDNDYPDEITSYEQVKRHFYMKLDGKKISISDIYISHDELTILMTGQKNNSSENTQSREFTSERKIPTDDTRSKCAEFIRDILYLYYRNDELRDKPWLLVRDDKTKGEPTELEQDFKDSKLSIPSRKSIKRWTEQK